MDSPDTGPRIGECEFASRTLPMHQGIYTVTLYEAKTGKKVAKERLTGPADFGPDRCPAMHVWREDEDPKVHSAPEASEYQRALGRYVDK